METLTVIMSTLAVGISAVTAWLTLFRRGSLRMTRPSLVFFGPDGMRGPAKVFVRAFLFSSGHRGVVLETLWAELQTPEGSQVFGSWISRSGGVLARESGLFVGPEGTSADHHFVVPRDSDFRFPPGHHRLTLFANIVGGRTPIRLWSDEFEVTGEAADGFAKLDTGLFFDWRPDARGYRRSLDRNRLAELNRAISEMVKLTPQELRSQVGPTFKGDGQARRE